VPYLSGSALTFTLNRAFARTESPGTTTVAIEKSASGGAFTPIAITTLSISSTYEALVTSGLGTVASGDLLRINWSALGPVAGTTYTVQLEGAQ
jgi:hypothetical protein